MQALVDLLNEILDHQIANRGSEHAFYSCYTYEYGKFPEWVLKAEHILSDLRKTKEASVLVDTPSVMIIGKLMESNLTNGKMTALVEVASLEYK